ncbi:hypothetical protein GGF46_002038 [Coemansia sp. RSA 552]|nr:hypothetical protein GGF46_002038 [Coemansia sp. RSA 552]
MALVYRQAILVKTLSPGLGQRGMMVERTTTNIGLIRSARATEMVRVVDFQSIHCPTVPEFLDNALELLGNDRWDHVECLNLKMYPRHFCSDSSGWLTEPAEYGEKLCRVFPGVREMGVIGSVTDSGEGAQFLGNVVTRYLGQLRRLESFTTLQFPTNMRFPAEITHLTVTDGGMQPLVLPHLNLDVLRKLSMHGLQQNFQWQQGFGTTDLQFNGLESLEVNYGSVFYDDHMGTVYDSVDLTMGFPKLRVLRITNCPAGNSALLRCGCFPPVLERARIYGSAHILGLLDRNPHLRRIAKLDFSLIASDYVGHDDFQTAANRVFGSTGVSPKNGYLYIGRQIPVAAPDQVCWSGLTRLLIMSPLEATVLLQLIRRLPNLISLVAFRTQMASATDAVRQEREEPSSCIQRLSVITGDNEECSRPLIEYLLALPCLRTLTVSQAHLETIREIAHSLPNHRVEGIKISSTSGGTSARGSVVDRVRWLEKAHGSEKPAPPPPRKLRLPKNFEHSTPSEPPTPLSAPVEYPGSPKLKLGLSPSLSEASTAPKPLQQAPKAAMPVLKPMGQLQPLKEEEPTQPTMSLPPAHARMPSVGSPPPEIVYQSSDSEVEAEDPEHAQEDEPMGTITVLGRAPVYNLSAGERAYSTNKLGGIRSRAPPALSRRYGKGEPEASSSVSVHSEEDATSPLPALRESRSLTNMNEYRRSPSLLSRLATLTAGRPNVQDLVSNQSGPKFVKRSHHYQSTPTFGDHPHSYGYTWGRSSTLRRFK